MSNRILLPSRVEYVLEKLGNDINCARRRRRISKAVMAQRAGITINTLTKVEEGSAGTSMAAWASILFILGLEENLKDLCDLKNDETGMMLADEELPKRIRSRKKNG